VQPFVGRFLEIALTPPRRSTSVFLAVALLFGVTIPVLASAPPFRASDAAAPGGRLIVLWRGHAPARIGIAGIDHLAGASVAQRSVVVAEPGKAGAVARALRADPRVLVVVPDARVKALDWPADGVPNDPSFGEQPDLEQVHVPEAWPTTTGDPGVVVAVIDSGVDLTHPDLAGVAVVAPRNEIWNNTDVSDDVGHGTHVAGTIFAQTNNATGIAGIAPTSTLMPVKVLDETGSGSIADVLDGVDWARTHGAKIINLSLGGSLMPDQVALAQPTFSAARAAGILVVAAAGNTGSPFLEYPAAFNGVVSVGAVDGSDVLADFSTFNRAVDMTAPGVETLSTEAGDYARESGTSMAAPHVAGGAALVWSARPTLGVDELEAVLRTSSVDLGDPGRDDMFGSGRLDVLAALTAPVPDPLPVFDPAPAEPLVFTFTSPTSPVTQTSSTFSVSWTVSHAVFDGAIARQTWDLIDGVCPDELEPDDGFILLDLVSPLHETGLTGGACYRWSALVIDADGQIAEVTSAPVTVVDITRPTITSRHPAPRATRVSRTASLTIKFSEPVEGVSSTTIRLKNVRTGKWVRARVTYSASRRTATIDPGPTLRRDTRYAVFVRLGITDPSGNQLGRSTWWFRTRR
jgi:subtilisin family serine protease